MALPLPALALAVLASLGGGGEQERGREGGERDLGGGSVEECGLCLGCCVGLSVLPRGDRGQSQCAEEGEGT